MNRGLSPLSVRWSDLCFDRVKLTILPITKGKNEEDVNPENSR